MKKVWFLFLVGFSGCAMMPMIAYGSADKSMPPPKIVEQPQIPQSELEKLYQFKGQLITQIDIAQAQLQEVNKRIGEILTKGMNIPGTPVPKEK